MVKKKSDPEVKSKILAVLRRGGIVIMPCDTIYGIVGRCSDTEEKIRKCKGRELKPFIRLIPNAEAAALYTDQLPPRQILSLWPGPLTLVTAHSGGGTIALRVPDDPLLNDILKDLKEHLFSTSVNITGKEALWKIRDIIETFNDKVDMIIDGGDLKGNKPSTVLDVTKKPYKILRQGIYRIPPELLR